MGIHSKILHRIISFHTCSHLMVEILTVDNCSIHYVSEIIDMIEATGALLHFLPTYSPDLNLIELAFSKMKTVIKNLESLMSTADIDTIIMAAFPSVTQVEVIHTTIRSLEANIIMYNV